MTTLTIPSEIRSAEYTGNRSRFVNRPEIVNYRPTRLQLFAEQIAEHFDLNLDFNTINSDLELCSGNLYKPGIDDIPQAIIRYRRQHTNANKGRFGNIAEKTGQSIPEVVQYLMNKKVIKAEELDLSFIPMQPSYQRITLNQNHKGLLSLLRPIRMTFIVNRDTHKTHDKKIIVGNLNDAIDFISQELDL